MIITTVNKPVAAEKQGGRVMKKRVLAYVLIGSLLLSSCSVTGNIPVSPAEDFEYEMVEGYVIITKYIGTDLEINIPEAINDRPVAMIGEEAFVGYDVSKVVLPDSITYIDYAAFADCVRLEEVSLGEGLNAIGTYAFDGCTKLTAIDLPDSLREIEDDAFHNCTSLKKASFPKSMETIGSAFGGCLSLEEIKWPETVQTIAAGAFSGCTSLAKVSLPDGLQRVEENAFSGCSSLAEVSLPDSLVVLSPRSFAGCEALTELELPNGALAGFGLDTEYEGVWVRQKLQLPTITYEAKVANLSNEDFDASGAVEMVRTNLKQEIETKEKPTTVLVVSENSKAFSELRQVESELGIDLQELGYYRIK